MKYQEKISYSRKDYKARAYLVAIDGKGYSKKNALLVKQFSKAFFDEYPAQPKCMYSVFGVEDEEESLRGYIFQTPLGWGYIVWISQKGYVFWYRNFNDLFMVSWHPQRSEAVAHLMRHWKSCQTEQREDNRQSTHYQPTTNHWNGHDHDCQILGLPQAFDLSQLKQAYRRLCMKHHPDTGDGDRQKLDSIISAYQRLKVRAQ